METIVNTVGEDSIQSSVIFFDILYEKLTCGFEVLRYILLLQVVCKYAIFEKGAALTLGSLVRRAICQIEMDQMSSASCGQYLKAM